MKFAERRALVESFISALLDDHSDNIIEQRDFLIAEVKKLRKENERLTRLLQESNYNPVEKKR